ncbi:nucleotide exchange factor GrpE [Candidatus Methylacidiphilum infernorum]|uniref:Protein GrpE n=1 Tax=Candidatus Methylacidiphilum infernorum TaxID=511746 RepID=A0ABX7PXB6_9BACT|nr:nucleotide exchange factor GrpE [Candidatus Methylacidiphilum infernorum]QSR87622.1 nucleotide exchange factor GrpE [Candidatus Methylacidiphilum infernorum]
MTELKNKEEKAVEESAKGSNEKPAFVVISSKLLSELEQKAQLCDESRDKLLRTLADWDNARKRMTKEKEEAIKLANAKILEALLPVIDNFEIGVQSSEKATDVRSVIDGVKMVLSQLVQILKEEGLEPLEAVGKPFDPNFHESLGFVETDKVEEGHVALQLRKGYMYKGRLLRAAAVYLAKKPEQKSDLPPEGSNNANKG